MKILVTGGSGLVGSAIQSISHLYPQYTFIFASSNHCDLTNWEQTIQYFKFINPDYVIHLAAMVGGLFKNMKWKVSMLETNLTINSNVLKASHQVNVKKLIGCLSTCIFPDKTTYPINETMLHDGPPHFSNDAYAYAKRILEVQCKAYHEQYGNNFVCVIPTNIYGPKDNFNLSDAHVIPALIHRCYLAKQSSSPFVIAGSGKPLRQFIYSEDLAKLFMWVLESYNDNTSIILSVGEKDEVSIGYIGKLIAQSFDYDYDSNIQFDETKQDGQFKKTADNSKLMGLYGNNIFEFTKISDGIEKSVKWFIENYDNCRK
jgi:GDP-L-fucose synthase